MSVGVFLQDCQELLRARNCYRSFDPFLSWRESRDFMYHFIWQEVSCAHSPKKKQRIRNNALVCNCYMRIECPCLYQVECTECERESAQVRTAGWQCLHGWHTEKTWYVPSWMDREGVLRSLLVHQDAMECMSTRPHQRDCTIEGQNELRNLLVHQCSCAWLREARSYGAWLEPWLGCRTRGGSLVSIT